MKPENSYLTQAEREAVDMSANTYARMLDVIFGRPSVRERLLETARHMREQETRE